MYCGLSTASEVFLIVTTQLYQYFSVFFLVALFLDEPEVFLSKYSQTTILHAAHFQRVVMVVRYLVLFAAGCFGGDISGCIGVDIIIIITFIDNCRDQV